MSLTLLFVCRRSINLANFSQIRSSLLRPLHLSPRILITEFSSVKTKYGSLKPSPSTVPNPFSEPTDDKTRRLKLQEHIRFREKFQLESDYELIYAMPRQRMYSLMHLLCTCASVTMFVFVIMHFHSEMLDIEPLLNGINQRVPTWSLYAIATIVGSMFGIILILISRMPVRVYYSLNRRSYALFYHPIISVLRQKKILFQNNQYRLVPQKLDNIESPQRSIKIHVQSGQGLLRMKKSFYLIESFFRSRRDIQRIRLNEKENDETINVNNKKEQNRAEEESDIWQTVVERKDQSNTNPPPARRTFMR